MALPTITKEEILEKLGINLDFELRDNDNPSNKVNRFINEVSEWCYDYLRINYGLNDEIDTLPAFRQGYFKQGVIKQIEYILRNGQLNIDSGYIRETGLVIDLSTTRLAPDAYTKFFLGAFCNLQNDKEDCYYA